VIKIVHGSVRSSLFEAVIEPANIPNCGAARRYFRVGLGFYTDPRPGDSFRLVFEKKFMKMSR